jgi:hypothetical protein
MIRGSGFPSRAGKSKMICAPCGAISASVGPTDIASIREGAGRSKAQVTASRSWQPKSPIDEPPKVQKSRQATGKYAG